jgi:hypothetical protein
MAKIPAKLRLGNKLEGDADKLQKQVDDMYLDIAPNLNAKPDMIILDRDPNDPGFTDDNSDIGSIWLNSSTGSKFILTALPSTWTPF